MTKNSLETGLDQEHACLVVINTHLDMITDEADKLFDCLPEVESTEAAHNRKQEIAGEISEKIERNLQLLAATTARLMGLQVLLEDDDDSD